MYGARVHETVLENKEKESGISIHYVNEEYDKGNIIFQARCKIEQGETADSLAKKVHKLEYEHYPQVIEELVDGI
ncbi:Phosphoribosylglycinamide formyltransferase [subsurface metagenome]